MPIKNTDTKMKISQERWDEIFKKDESSQTENIKEVSTRKKHVKRYVIDKK